MSTRLGAAPGFVMTSVFFVRLKLYFIASLIKSIADVAGNITQNLPLSLSMNEVVRAKWLKHSPSVCLAIFLFSENPFVFSLKNGGLDTIKSYSAL